MPDRRRLVTRSPGGQHTTLLDLEVADTYAAVRDSFTYDPGGRAQASSREPSRYGGGRIISDRRDNGSVSWLMLVIGTSEMVVAQRVEALLVEMEKVTNSSTLLEWRPEGVAYSSFFRVAGPGSWKPTYRWAQFTGAKSMIVEISVPVRPLVLWDQMTIEDEFSTDTIAAGDYTFEIGSGTVAVSNGVLTVSTIGDKRLYHTSRGYTYKDVDITLKYTTGASVASFHAGVVLRRIDPNNYIRVFVDAANLVISKVDAATGTTLASAAAATTANTPYWVRGRVVGNVIVAERWTTNPDLGGTPAQTITHTLTGADITKFGAGVAGFPAFRITPGGTDWTFDDFKARPFAELALDALAQPADTIPGTAPALVDLVIGGHSPSVRFGMFAWTPRKTASSGALPFGYLPASAADLSGGAWTLSGGRAIDTTATDAETYQASWSIDLSALSEDEFRDGVCDVEVWVRAYLDNTLVTPTLSAFFLTGGFGYTYANDLPGGRVLTLPSAGNKNRLTRLGTFTLPVAAVATSLFVNGDVGAGSAGDFGIEYALLVPARRRALTPTGVAPTGYPEFIKSTGTKRFRHDLMGFFRSGASTGFAQSTGLGGSLQHLAPGAVDLLVKTSNGAIPDDPTINGADETPVTGGSFRLDITPRSHLLRA